MRENISLSPVKSDVAVLSNLDDICVAGITPFTTIDFPGRLAGVFYLQGCLWQCRYCYNTEFWPLPPLGKRISIEKIIQFLQARKGHLDGIVFSGGEPLLHERLSVWMETVKSMGFEIGLHTSGMFPERLEKILPLCDWVGLDIKAPFHLYEKVTRVPGSGVNARRSAELVLASRVPCEFRTTFHPAVLSDEDMQGMALVLATMGCKQYAIQMFHVKHCYDMELSAFGLPVGISPKLRHLISGLFPAFQVRE